MRNKDLARPTPVDFCLPQFNKKQKSDNLSIKNTQIYIPRHYSDFDSIFNSMSSDSSNSSIIPVKSVVEDKSDSFNSILSRLQGLTLSSDQEEPVHDNKLELLNIKKDILNTCIEPRLTNKRFTERFEATVIATAEEIVEPLTDEENQIVNRLFRKGQVGQLSQFKNATVSYADIYRLYPEVWLNDEIVNFYFELLSDRASKTKDLPSIHCYNTFFCSTLRDQGYAKVRRWTKRVDVFEKDLLFIPINQSYHWILGVIDLKNKTVSVYDSLGGNHDHTLTLFLRYLEQEHLDKKKTPFDTSDWQKRTPKDIPRQGNMSDCGAFTCTFAERLSRHKPFNFSQHDMETIRRRMALNIYNKSL